MLYDDQQQQSQMSIRINGSDIFYQQDLVDNVRNSF